MPTSIQNKKPKALLGTFAAWEKYLAAARECSYKQKSSGGETIPPTSKDTNTKKVPQKPLLQGFQIQDQGIITPLNPKLTHQ